MLMSIPILTQDSEGWQYKPVEPRLPRLINPSSGNGLGGSGGGDDDKKKCPVCLGTQNCTKCDGTGTKDSFCGSKECKKCDGTGICQTCRGLAYI